MRPIPDDLLESVDSARGPSPRQRRARSVLTLIFAVMFGFLLSWTINAVKAYHAASGDDVPREPPAEAHRVVHPDGFSLVFPRNWSVEASDAHALTSSPKARGSSRGTPAQIYLARLGPRRPADAADWHRTTFQGEPALAEVHSQVSGSPRFERTLFFQRGSDWYLLRYVVGEVRQTLPWMIQRYFDTFRVEQSGT